ncbi:MAG: ADP-forming succinate--CoA ligase subunit beta [Bdellovibrionales bacterium]|nr:ADP-forming succinate--CoA ligase subunit beta [Bdellovibrionales bacterium]
MKIHEYQAKELFRSFNIPTLKGIVAKSADEAVEAAKQLGGQGPWVVKAQIHAGGRGKGGGVKLAKSFDEVKEYASAILAKPLVTPQTGPEGKNVNTLLVEEGCNIEKEYYFAALLDRATSSIVVMGSTEGGMDIEEVAEKTPEKIVKVHVDPAVGFLPYQARLFAFEFGLGKDLQKSFHKMMSAIVDAFIKTDASLLEINPLVQTKDNQMIALDAKMTFDENALYRHPNIKEYFDPNEEDPQDLEAAKWNLNYIRLDGNIGCMVNGAGLAMATMDIIKFSGGSPANFLDVGGGANTEMVREAFKILVGDKNVQCILVNIFGGIMKCDVLAQGIVDAASQISLSVPLVVRLEGTNVEKGREILDKSGLNIITASNMGEAATLAVKHAGN